MARMCMLVWIRCDRVGVCVWECVGRIWGHLGSGICLCV